MKARLLIFLSALSFILLGMTAGLRAQPQETGAAARRVIIFVWDGLRADDLTPEITPNYFAAMGIPLGPADYAIRCNLVNVEDGVMRDFTAGHIGNDEAEALINPSSSRTTNPAKP